MTLTNFEHSLHAVLFAEDTDGSLGGLSLFFSLLLSLIFFLLMGFIA